MGYNAMRTYFIKNDPEMCVGNTLPYVFDEGTWIIPSCENLDELLCSLSYNKDRKELYILATDEDCTFDDIQIIEEKPFIIITLSNVRIVNPWYYNHFDTVVMEFI